MAPRSLASSSLKSGTRMKPSRLDCADMYNRRHEYDRPGSSYSQNRKPRKGELEDAFKPRLESFYKGSWWEVDILEHRDRSFRAKYRSNLVREDAWIPLNQLRLKNRKSDDWDCHILKRGMDVSVDCTHPNYKELDFPPRAIYDARITNIARAAHNYECTCKFQVRLYSTDTEDPIGCTKDRELVNQSFATKDVTISTVSILQQPGIVPFYEILRSHLSCKWIPVKRWSNDAFFLRETKLDFHLPPKYGENRLYDDDDDLEEALLAAGATQFGRPDRFTHSSRVYHSREQKTVKVPAPRAKAQINPRRFLGSDMNNCSEHFTSTGGDPNWENTKFSKFVPGISAARGGMNDGDGGCRKDSESREDKVSYNDDEVDDLEEALLTTGGAVQSEKREQFTHSPKVFHSCEQDTAKAPAPKAKSQINPGEFFWSEVNNSSEHFTATGGDPGEENIKAPNLESDISAARGGMGGDGRRKDSASRGVKLAFVDQCIPRQVKVGGKRSRDDVPTSPQKKQGVNPEQINKRSVSGQKEGEFPSRTSCKDADITATSDNDMVDIRAGSSSSEERNVYIQPPSKRVAAKNLQSSGRRSDKVVPKEARRKLKSDNGSLKPKPGGEFEKVTNRKDNPGAGLANAEEEEDACEGLQMDSTIKGNVAGRTEGPKTGWKKVETNTVTHEENETSRETKKPLSRLRPRSCVKKKVPGASAPASLRPYPLKSNFAKGNGLFQKPSGEPLYVGLFDVNLDHEKEKEKEKRVDNTVIIDMQRKPKCGLNSTWDPTSFRYPTPILEEKQAELQQQQQQQCSLNRQRQQKEQQQKQPKQSVAENSKDSEEGSREQKTLLPDQEGQGSTCLHLEEFLKEDVGIICCKCAVVLTPIEAVVPSVETRQPRHSGEASDWDAGRRSPDAFQQTTEYQRLHQEKEVTWMGSCSLPLRIQVAMHPHQKDGFSFLWKHLAHGEGSNRRMREDRKAGCILSHAPGTGKTFLVIAFLQSYMEQFPTCRPLIVAPKIMLRQWEKEFQRWKSDISVYILNTARDSGKRLLQIHRDAGFVKFSNLKNVKDMNPRRQLDVYRAAMLYEWSKSRSVILVSYNLFSCLTDDSRDYSSSREGEHVRQTLLEVPTLLVLDEGHFPRNKGTRIRRSLMAVKTNIRILLSGTLFQNNFEELFNTLYLVRPGFVEGFARFGLNSSEEDTHSNLKTKVLEMEKVTKEAEHRARKMFLEEVGMKIEQGQSSKAHSVELEYGLERLGALTCDFVHHHTGEVLAALPGLRDFALILKPTQQQCSLLEVLQKHFKLPTQYLEREISVSQTSIHPALVRGLEFTRSLDINNIFKHYRELKSEPGSLGAAPGSTKSFASGASKKEAMDPSDGVKTKFVFDLLCFSKPEKEKVLIFSQHITPLDLLIDMFTAQFKWRENIEYLKLDGKLCLDERAKIIEKFNNPDNGVCVLLASTKACGEGISLIGASRVVFLDVLWNPAVIKQAISRAFRLGQKKIVYVYRLIASGTVEETKYKKAIRKDWLSRSIFSASQGKPHELLDTIDENAGKVPTVVTGGERGMEDIRLDRNSVRVEEARSQESPVDKEVGLRTCEGEDEDVHRLRKIQELLAWEVDLTTCKDAMLEMVLETDKHADRKTFLKVIEHGSDFREKTLPFGPDAREWFLEGAQDNDPVDMKDVHEAEAEPSTTDSDEEEDM